MKSRYRDTLVMQKPQCYFGSISLLYILTVNLLIFDRVNTNSCQISESHDCPQGLPFTVPSSQYYAPLNGAGPSADSARTPTRRPSPSPASARRHGRPGPGSRSVTPGGSVSGSGLPVRRDSAC
eukprot:768344-Hanusia_phi.AAC.15